MADVDGMSSRTVGKRSSCEPTVVVLAWAPVLPARPPLADGVSGRMTMVAVAWRADAPGVSRTQHLGAIMTAFVLEPQPFRRGPAPAEAVAVGLASIVAVLTLFAAGVTFFGLAIGGRLVDLRIVFAVLSVVAFVVSAAVTAKAFGFLSPRE